MGAVISEILKMSLTASVVILVVTACRFLLKRSQKKYLYLLWAAVGFRLLCPISLKSGLSIFNLKPAAAVMNKVDPEVIKTGEVTYQNYVHTAREAAQIAHQTVPVQQVEQSTHLFAPELIITVIWATVAAVLLGCAIFHFIKLRHSLRDSIRIEKGIYENSRIDSPFAMGVISPKIYLPTGLSAIERQYLVEHERTHIRRGDLFFKLLAVIALSIHWFNPLVWLAYVLFSRDMEMSCDEIVIEKMGDEIRKCYSVSLVTLAQKTKVRNFVITTTAFSKNAVGKKELKMRIENVLGFKKCSGIVAVITCVVVLTIALTSCLDASAADKAISGVTDGESNEISVKETTAIEEDGFYFELNTDNVLGIAIPVVEDAEIINEFNVEKDTIIKDEDVEYYMCPGDPVEADTFMIHYSDGVTSEQFDAYKRAFEEVGFICEYDDYNPCDVFFGVDEYGHRVVAQNVYGYFTVGVYDTNQAEFCTLCGLG